MVPTINGLVAEEKQLQANLRLNRSEKRIDETDGSSAPALSVGFERNLPYNLGDKPLGNGQAKANVFS